MRAYRSAEENVCADHEWQDEQRVVQREAFGKAECPEGAACDHEHELNVEEPCGEYQVVALEQQGH